MQELIKKISENLSEIAEYTKNGDNEAIIKKIEENTTAISELSEKITKNSESLMQKDVEISEQKEKIEKYADLHISSDTFKELLGDLKEAVTEKIQNIGDGLSERLEKIESATPKASRQKESKEIEKKINPLTNLANRFNS